MPRFLPLLAAKEGGGRYPACEMKLKEQMKLKTLELTDEYKSDEVKHGKDFSLLGLKATKCRLLRFGLVEMTRSRLCSSRGKGYLLA